MKNKKQSAQGTSLISRRRVLGCALACMAGIAGGLRPVAAFGETDLMRNGTEDLHFTYETLAMIRQNLLEVLKRQEPGDDYAHLVSEIETGNAPPMIVADSVYIGRWKLIRRDNKFLLETQQIQVDMPTRLIYTAPLAWRDGRWKVSAVYIKTVRRR